jgi:hypothetical protein
MTGSFSAKYENILRKSIAADFRPAMISGGILSAADPGWAAIPDKKNPERRREDLRSGRFSRESRQAEN